MENRKTAFFIPAIWGSFSLLFLILGMPFTNINANNQNVDSSLIFRNISREDGLHQNSIFAIIQDRNGFIWLANQVGVSRFDGLNFKLYSKKEGINGIVNALAEDSHRHRLWIAHDRGLSCINTLNYKSEEIPALEPIKNMEVTALSVIGENELIFGAGASNKEGQNLLFSYKDGKLDTIKRIPNGINFIQVLESKIAIASGDSIYIYDKKNNSLRSPIFSFDARGSITCLLYYDRQDEIWIGRKKKNVARYKIDGGNYSLKLIGEIPNTENAVSILYDRNNNLWVGTSNLGLRFFRDIPPGLSGLGELKCDFIYNGGNKEKIDHSISSNLILSLYESADGVIWVGTDGRGVDLYSPDRRRFEHHFDQLNFGDYFLPSNDVWAFYLPPGSKNIVWIGTEGSGLVRYDIITRKAHVNKYIKKEEIGDNRHKVRSIAKLGDKFILGTADGLFQMKESEGNSEVIIDLNMKFQDHTFAKAPPSILAIKIFEEKEIAWIGTDKGLYKASIHSDSITNIRKISWFEPKTVTVIEAGWGDEDLWIGTQRGLYLCDPSSGAIQDSLLKFETSHILSIYKISSAIWVGGNAIGLNKVKKDDSKWLINSYGLEQGLPNNVVYRIEKDNNNNLWLSTNMGISHFIPINATFINYSRKDGLQENEFNRGASGVDENRNIFFGGVNGFSVLRYPDKNLRSLTSSIPILMLHFQDGAESIIRLEKDTTILLKHDPEPLNFRLLAFDYRYSDKCFYKIKIGEKETASAKDFQLPRNGGVFSYIYEVEFFITDAFGNNLSRDKFKIKIKPNRTLNWIILLTLLVLFGVIFAIVNYMKKRKEARKIKAIFEILTNIGREITTNDAPDKVYEILEKNLTQQILLNYLNSDVFSIDMYEEGTEELITRFDLEEGTNLYNVEENRAHYSVKKEEDSERFPVICYHSGESLFMPNVSKDYRKYVRERKIPKVGGKKQGVIYVPIKVLKNDKEVVLGTITIQTSKRNVYTRSLHLAFLESLSSMISMAIIKDDKIISLAASIFQPKIDSHFIKGCFSDISDLIESGNYESVAGYSEVLRNLFYLLFHKIENKPSILIQDEIIFLETYIEAMRIKFAEEFSIQTNDVKIIGNEEDVYKIQIPPMFIQPYVENAIKHGLRYAENGDRKLSILFQKTENYLECIVEDNGIGINKAREETSRFPRQSNELRSNEKNRIRAKYIDQYNKKWQATVSTKNEDISIQETDLSEIPNSIENGTRITVKIPLSFSYPPSIGPEELLKP